jgi:hypothetical protein
MRADDLRDVLRQSGITKASRATTTDSTEEVILLTKQEVKSVDVTALTTALMEVLPHTKVWLVEEHPRWSSEPL